MSEGERFLVFVGIWVVLGIVSGIVMWRASFEAKRKWFPRIGILAGGLFVALVCWVSGNPKTLYFTVPATAIIIFLNLKLVKFCPKCAAYNPFWDGSRSVRYCAYCGFQLSQHRNDDPAPPNNALEQTRDR